MFLRHNKIKCASQRTNNIGNPNECSSERENDPEGMESDEKRNRITILQSGYYADTIKLTLVSM